MQKTRKKNRQKQKQEKKKTGDETKDRETERGRTRETKRDQEQHQIKEKQTQTVEKDRKDRETETKTERDTERENKHYSPTTTILASSIFTPCLFVVSSNFVSENSMAAEETETAPRAISVSVRTRFPAETAVFNKRARTLPAGVETLFVAEEEEGTAVWNKGRKKEYIRYN